MKPCFLPIHRSNFPRSRSDIMIERWVPLRAMQSTIRCGQLLECSSRLTSSLFTIEDRGKEGFANRARAFCVVAFAQFTSHSHEWHGATDLSLLPSGCRIFLVKSITSKVRASPTTWLFRISAPFPFHHASPIFVGPPLCCVRILHALPTHEARLHCTSGHVHLLSDARVHVHHPPSLVWHPHTLL